MIVRIDAGWIPRVPSASIRVDPVIRPEKADLRRTALALRGRAVRAVLGNGGGKPLGPDRGASYP